MISGTSHTDMKTSIWQKTPWLGQVSQFMGCQPLAKVSWEHTSASPSVCLTEVTCHLFKHYGLLPQRKKLLSMEFHLTLHKMVFSSSFWAVAVGLMGKMRKLNYICTNNSSFFLKLQLLTCCANSECSVALERSQFENLNLWIQGFLPLGTPLRTPEAEGV